MLHPEYQAITHWLHNNPQWGGIAAFIIAFTESLAIIGTIIPGSITMTAIGIMMGSNVLPLESTLFLAILGAIVGDSFSYIIGYTFRGQIQNTWPFSRYPAVLNHGKVFFTNHGGKSVLLGRFVGPIRALIPLIAGILHMKPIRFFPYDIIAAIIWAPLYLLPGFFIGVAAQSLPADVATQLILLIIAVLVVIWLVFWLIKTTSTYLTKLLNKANNYIWQKMIKHKYWHWLCRLIKNAQHPHDPGQLGLLFIALLSSFLVTLIFVNVAHGPTTHINLFIYHLFRGFRTLALDKVMVFSSAFGNKAVILPVAAIIFAWLGLTRRWWAAWHWLIAFILSVGILGLFRTLHFSPRPPGIFFIKPSSSFPSGHSVLATTFYFLLAWMISIRRPQWKKILYYIAAILVALICLSRLYLGDHWFTDIIAGIFVGIFSISVVVISYRHKINRSPHSTILFVIAVFALIISTSTYLTYTYQDELQNSQLVWEERNVLIHDWWDQEVHNLPTYRKNRLGKPIELLNIQWAGNLEQIHQSLEQAGWKDIASIEGQVMTHELLHDKNLNHLQLLPVLFEDQKPVINMVKEDIDNHFLVLRLWSANVRLMPQDLPLWIGTINNEAYKHHKIFHHIYQLIPVNEALEALGTALSNNHWKTQLSDPKEVPLQLNATPNVPSYKILLREYH